SGMTAELAGGDAVNQRPAAAGPFRAAGGPRARGEAGRRSHAATRCARLGPGAWPKGPARVLRTRCPDEVPDTSLGPKGPARVLRTRCQTPRYGGVPCRVLP